MVRRECRTHASSQCSSSRRHAVEEEAKGVRLGQARSDACLFVLAMIERE